MSDFTVAYLVGSLSANSINRKLARALGLLGAPELDLVEVPIHELPLYNHDLDHDYPAPARALKDGLAAADAVLLVTPEYNRGVPGSLKNALDWASRPWGQNSFAGKPSAVIGTSPSPLATAVAQTQANAFLTFSGSPQMGQPEGYIQFAPGLITDQGEVTVPGTAEFLRSWMIAFHAHIRAVLAGQASA